MPGAALREPTCREQGWLPGLTLRQLPANPPPPQTVPHRVSAERVARSLTRRPHKSLSNEAKQSPTADW